MEDQVDESKVQLHTRSLLSPFSLDLITTHFILAGPLIFDLNKVTQCDHTKAVLLFLFAVKSKSELFLVCGEHMRWK